MATTGNSPEIGKRRCVITISLLPSRFGLRIKLMFLRTSKRYSLKRQPLVTT